MKHTKVAVAAALACAACIPAIGHAQSSVTLYGILDAGITYVNNTGGSHVVKFDDGVAYGNRFGLKGTEDLGGGLKAVFTLESGFHLGNGQLGFGGAEFGRQAYVGLQNDWGTLSFGNQLDITNGFVSIYNISAWGSGYAIHQGDFDRFNGDRLPNSVKFLSNDLSGFKFGAMYSFGNVAGNFHRNSAWSAGASFTKGDFSIGAAYTRLNNPNGIYAFDPYAMIGTHTFLGQQTVTVDPATGARTDLFSNTAMDVDSQGTFGIGTSYTIGKLTLDANYSAYDDQGLRPVVAHAGVRRWRPVPVHAGAEPHRGLPAHALRRPPLEPGARPACTTCCRSAPTSTSPAITCARRRASMR